MIVFEDGNYETGYWLTKDTYPGKVCYFVEEDSILARKVMSLKYRKLIISDGELVDVEEREPTPDENSSGQPPKTPEYEELKQENADLKSRLADIELVLAEIIAGGGV